MIKPTNRKGRALKRRKTVVNDEDDFSEGVEAEVVDEGRSAVKYVLPFARILAYMRMRYR